MDTKWKNRLKIIAWLVLFAFGVSGVLSALINDNDYHQKVTLIHPNFKKIDNLTRYIHAFEVTYQSKEEMKEAITVTEDEIEVERYKYGNLTEQIMNIEQQYQSRIEEAKANDNQDIADIYIKERDQKIDEVTKDFESDEKIKNAIIKEKKKTLMTISMT